MANVRPSLLPSVSLRYAQVADDGRAVQGGNTMAALGLQKPLFKAALGFSMFLPTQVTATSPTAQAIYDNLVAATGCYGAQSTFSCLQSANADVLAAAGINLSQNRPAGVWTYLPVIDGKFLTARASTLLAKGQQNLNGVRQLPLLDLLKLR